jgi:RNA polymerase sigma factor (sigma-70 family)
MGVDRRAQIGREPTDDLGELYSALSGRLEQIVRGGLRGSDAVIEDACQFAWTRLVDHSDRVERETALGWLAKTAFHEALKLTRRRARELRLVDELQHGDGMTPHPGAPGPAELVEQRQALRAIGTLPVRQQRVLWLRGLGLSYGEMAAHEECTRRTVERQLARARRSLREWVAE